MAEFTDFSTLISRLKIATERWWYKRGLLSSHRRTRLSLEPLGDRIVPATNNIWLGAESTAWNTNANWSLGHFPRQDEIAVFLDDPEKPNDTRACVLPANTSPTVYGLDIRSSWDSVLLLRDGNTLTVTNVITQAGSTISLGTLVFQGQDGGIFTWSAGKRDNRTDTGDASETALTKIEGAGQLKMTGDSVKELDGANVEIRSNTSWDGGNIILRNDARVSVIEATFTINTGAGKMQNNGEGVCGITVTSNLTMAANNEVTIDADFVNHGAVSVNSGTLKIVERSTFHQNSTVSVAANSTFNLASGFVPHELKGTTISGAGNFEFRGEIKVSNTNTVVGLHQYVTSELTGGGTLVLAGNQASTWGGGTWNGTGRVQVQVGTVLNITADAGVDKLVAKGGWGLKNFGTVNLTAGQTVEVDGGTTVENSGTFNIQGAEIDYSGNGGEVGAFVNAGTLVASGANDNFIALKFINNINQSKLRLNDAVLRFSAAIEQLHGETYINGGNLHVGGTGFVIDGGVLKGFGTITTALVDNGATIDQTGLGEFQDLSIVGKYKQRGTGELKLKIDKAAGALSFDKLITTGEATLAGKLTVVAQPGYTPQGGDVAMVMTFGSRVGDFGVGQISIPAGMVSVPGATSYKIQKLKPNINLMLPNAGPVFGGTLVTITGEGFLGTTGVSFGGTAAASFTVVSDSELQAVSPAHSAGTVVVSVTSPNGTSDSSTGSTFTYELVNSTTTLSSSQNPAPPGTQVTFTATVTGSGPTPPTGTVEFWEVDPVSGANLALLGTATLDQYGHAVISWTSSTSGTRRIKALYLGDDNYSSSFAILDQVFGSGPGSGSG